MRFQPKTQAEIDASNMLAEGRYPFTVLEAKEKQDKNGNPYFNLKLSVHAPDDRNWFVFDNVSPFWMEHKLLHLCDTTGLNRKYESGELAPDDLVGRQGYCEVSVQEASGGYPAKNVIFDYYTAQEIRREKPAEVKRLKPVSAKHENPADDSDDVAF